MIQRLALIFSLCLAAALSADDSAKGAFESYVAPARPKLAWEALKGYRLFFDPSDKEPLRRSLNLWIPTERHVLSAFSLVRPLEPNPEFNDAWLRVEGVVEEDRIKFQWDGMYRGAEFPDKAYYYEIHVRWKDGERLDQKVVILKSKDHPRLVKVGAIELDEHPMVFKKGEYLPESIAATVSRAQFPQLPLIARSLVPTLEDVFHTEGLQVSYKYIEDLDGLPPQRPQDWTCACQAPLPLDSPARKASKKVRCDWDLSSIQPGVYDLRLSLYHKMKHPAQFDPCDTPVLDEDRIRVMVRP